MNVQNMASRFIRIPLRVAWISTGIATLFAVLLIVHQDLWIMGTWLAHITSIPWQYAVILIGLAAMLLSAFIAGIAAVIISFQGTKEMRSTLSMMAEASALYAAGRSHAGGSVRSAVYYMTSDVMSCKIEVVKFICSSIMNK